MCVSAASSFFVAPTVAAASGRSSETRRLKSIGDSHAFLLAKYRS
jgi:hypothetical protein